MYRSSGYLVIMNLISAADWHKKYCQGENCAVILGLLKAAAVQLLQYNKTIPEDEQKELTQLITEAKVWF